MTGRLTARVRAGQDERTKLEGAYLLQQQWLAAQRYAEAVIEAVPPLLVLDEKLRVQTANASFCRAFKVSPRQALHRKVYELGNGQWNIPVLRKLLEEVLARKRFFNNFEVTHEFEDIGRRTMLLSGRQVDHLKRILLLINDVTEQRKSQEALRASELRYRRLFEAARDGILIVDPATRTIQDANPFMTELLGYPHGELLGKELWEIGLLADEKVSRSAFRQLQQEHFIRYDNLPLEDNSGSRHEVEFVSNLYDEGGKKVIQCNVRDVTERKRAEEALRRNEERYRTLFNSIDEGFCVVEVLFDGEGCPRDYRFVEVNPSFEKHSGLRNALGKCMRELSPRHEAHWFDVFGRVAMTGEAVRFVREAKALGKWFDAFAFRLGDAEGRRVAVLFTDITERRTAEQALLKAKNEIGRHALNLEEAVMRRTTELRETIAELEGFSYSISHDMRAPLRAMQGFASYLLEEYQSRLDERGVLYLQQIMRSAVRLDRLIQDILSYSRILKMPLPMRLVDLDRLVRDLIQVQPNGSPNIRLDIMTPLPTVLGNEASLTQCITNLLANAVKFVPPGTAPHVQIWAAESSPEEKEDPGCARTWRLFIRDNGLGIAPENHERIFHLFERINPGTAYEGTGVGLTIARKAIERMGGRIGFDSVLGEGSTFWIQIKKAPL